MNSIVVFSGRAHPGLARAISRRLKIRLSPSTTSRFSNGCLGVQLEANCREADVFLIQPLVPPVQEHLMELLLMLDAARGASAARIDLPGDVRTSRSLREWRPRATEGANEEDAIHGGADGHDSARGG
jgi:hypothetical protein